MTRGTKLEGLSSLLLDPFLLRSEKVGITGPEGVDGEGNGHERPKDGDDGKGVGHPNAAHRVVLGKPGGGVPPLNHHRSEGGARAEKSIGHHPGHFSYFLL
jgi:hypothetical protein